MNTAFESKVPSTKSLSNGHINVAEFNRKMISFEQLLSSFVQ